MYPGDTVTLFANITNTGTGKVYATTLNLNLIKEGNTLATIPFTIGDISAGKTAHFTTGMVLSKKIAGGEYTIQINANGTTGNNNTAVTATGYSTFNVFSFAVEQNTSNPITTIVKGATTQKSVLGTKTTPVNDASLYLALLYVLLGYLVVRLLRARQELLELFSKNVDWKSKVNSLRLFLV